MNLNFIIRNTLVSLLLGSVSMAYGAPSMNVIVSDASDQLAFRGATNTDGTFATGTLRPGHYVVQFASKNGAANGDQYLLVLSAGKKIFVSSAVAGEKFAAGGVAVKMDVGVEARINGQLASAQALGSARVKMINGKRYYWMQESLGSNLQGRWVEEGLAKAQNVVRLSSSEVRKLQDRGGEGSMLNGMNQPELHGHGY